MSGCPCSTSTSSSPLSLLPSSSVPSTPRCSRVAFSSCGPRRSGMRRRGTRDCSSKDEKAEAGEEGEPAFNLFGFVESWSRSAIQVPWSRPLRTANVGQMVYTTEDKEREYGNSVR
ncbi:uncharacterized protein [Triticum aestivum]|uniref:uncharacterized protein n=1 Tax=Triticum aestivum TaxID=4565 RepID=UPI001D01509F|nr:uncharacterized protein LOC123042454 [Triticum aestivum]